MSLIKLIGSKLGINIPEEDFGKKLMELRTPTLILLNISFINYFTFKAFNNASWHRIDALTFPVSTREI